MSEPTTPFDWEQVLARLDGEHPGTPAIEPDLVAAMRRLLLLVCSQPRFRARADARRAGVRMYALVWLTDPSIIPGAPGLRELAAMIGCHANTLARITGRMSRDLGLRNRAQRHRHARLAARNTEGAVVTHPAPSNAPKATHAPAVGNSKSNAIAR